MASLEEDMLKGFRSSGLTHSTQAVFLLLALGASDARGEENSLTAGSWALQFQIQNNLTLGNFDGLGIALKRHLSGGSALRGGVNFTTSGSSQELRPDSVQTRADSDLRGVRAALHYVWYPRPQADVNLFMGIGPAFGYLSNDSLNSASGRERSSETSEWQVGAHGILGAEWFATRSLGIHAEYEIAYQYASSEATVSTGTPETKVTRNTDRWSFGTSAVRFGLSVYF